MAPPHLISAAFSGAQALVDELSDPEARQRLTELQRQSRVLSPYHPRQDYLLEQVNALTQQFRRRQEELGRAGLAP